MKAFNTKTGYLIKGTSDTIPGTALILQDTFTSDGKGNVEFEWDGETEVGWDGQTTDERDGQRVFIDDGWNECLERDLLVSDVEECDECGAEIPTAATEHVNIYHYDSCSLHKENVQ